MTTLRFLLFFLSIAGVFVSGALFFRSPFLRNRSLSIFILLFSLQILDFIYATSKVIYLYPHFAGLYFFASGFLYGPLFYFHIRSFDEEKTKLERKQLLHFIPFFVMIWLTRDLYLTPNGYDRMQIIDSQFFNRILYYNYAIVAHIVAYGFVILVELKKLHRKLSASNSAYILGICSIYLVSMIMHALFVEFAGSWRDFAPYYFTISIYFLLIGYLLYTNPKFLTTISGKYFSSNLGEGEMKKIISKMDNLFEDEEIYLLRNLSLSQVAEKLDIASYKISQSLSTLLKSNFNDYVNKYRVKYAEGLLKSPDFQHFKIEAIAIDSGFNNKVTFYKAFTSIHQVTPSSFRKSHS